MCSFSYREIRMETLVNLKRVEFISAKPIYKFNIKALSQHQSIELINNQQTNEADLRPLINKEILQGLVFNPMLAGSVIPLMDRLELSIVSFSGTKAICTEA